jgi:hypothetical protein
MRPFSNIGVWALSLGALGACGGSDGSTASTDPTVSDRDFASQYADIVCGGQKDCCTRGGQGFEEAACHSQVLADIQKVQARAAKVSASYDPQRGSACLDLLRHSYDVCKKATNQTREEVCSALFHGTASEGTACSGDECGYDAGGALLRCARMAPSSAVPFTCQPVSLVVASIGPRGALGEACRDTCSLDLVNGEENCHSALNNASPDAISCYTNDNLYCDGQHCAARLGGSSACQTSDDCGEGFLCSADHCGLSPSGCSMKGVCLATPAAGSPCQDDSSCGNDAYCDDPGKACVSRKAIGQPCSESPSSCQGALCLPRRSQCVSGLCELGVCADPADLTRAVVCASLPDDLGRSQV